MMLWLVLALMTFAAVFAVLWPLSRRTPLRAGSDVAVYRDQLDEIERDLAAGLIGEREGAAARIEVSRRLLAAAESEPTSLRVSVTWRWVVAIAVSIVLPLGAGTFYVKLGSPELAAPRSLARNDSSPEDRPMSESVGRVEAYLEQNPEDGRGWDVLGQIYMRLDRYDDAVRARRNALRILAATASLEADLGEALTAAAGGVVTAEARQAFERAARLDPKDVPTRYFLGLVAEQDGSPKEAAEAWRALLAEAPADADWVGFVRQSLKRVDPSATASPPGPTTGDISAANEMSPEQRTAMVHSMVSRLAERLKQEGGDVEGWLRLLRAYMVLGNKEGARAAAIDARRALTNDPDKLLRVDDLIKALGIEG
jgi:cytochrome c-type biogenesis protein CcmH